MRLAREQGKITCEDRCDVPSSENAPACEISHGPIQQHCVRPEKGHRVEWPSPLLPAILLRVWRTVGSSSPVGVESPDATNDIDVIWLYDDPMIVASSPQHDGREPVGELSARDAEILTFERQWWKFAGAKEQAIRDKFQMSATRYYQVLNALIDKPEALAQDPLLVKRLRRLRATRQRNRSAKRLGIDLTIE
jgi:Protein of unknown function (DUF3263)